MVTAAISEAVAAANWQESLRLVNEELESHPTDAQLHDLRGYCFLQLGAPESATAEFGRAHALSPLDAETSFHYAWSLERIGRRAEAWDIAHDALRNAPNHPGLRSVERRCEVDHDLSHHDSWERTRGLR